MTSPIETVGESEIEEDERIDEPSPLDGDSFVAPTRDAPYGAYMRESEPTAAMEMDEGGRERERERKRGVMGLLGEVYQDASRWN